MGIRRIAPLAIGLALPPCAFAQSADELATGRNGHWYISASVAAVQGPQFTYDGSDIPDLVDIDYTDTTDDGTAVEAAVGYAFSNGLRAEAAITLQRHGGVQTRQQLTFIGNPPAFLDSDFPGDHVEATSLNLNVYYDFARAGAIQPYLGAGAGIVTVDVEDAVMVARDPGVSLQAMAGVSFKASKSLTLYVEGRWQKISDITSHAFDLSTSLPITPEFDFSTLSARAGLRLSF